ncbi:MAG: O-antigen ligase family protein [Elusimicrobiota bacterium]|nr:O-antigen ligase family protein [Elusimicrobiota bacterium]
MTYAFGACAAAALLFFWTLQADAYGSPRLAALALTAALSWAGLWHRPGWRRTPLDAPLLGSLAALVLSLAAAADPYLGIVGMYSLHTYGLAGFLLCACVYLACAWSDEPLDPDRLLLLALWAAAAAAAYGLLQKAGLEPFAGVRAAGSGRIGGPQGDPVPFGACLLLFIPVAAHFWRDPSPSRRGAARVGGALVLAALGLTLSRGAWLGAAAGLSVYLWLSGAASFRRRTLLLIASATAAAVLAAAFLRPTAKASDSARLALWDSVARSIPRHPWLGAGPDSVQALLRRDRTEAFIRALGPTKSQVSAHNDFLQVAATLGLAGLAAYLWLLFGAWRCVSAALRESRHPSAVAAIAGALAGLFVQAKFNPVPLGALVLAAMFLGLTARAAPAPGRAVPFKTAALSVCVVVFGLGLWLCRADRQFHLARSYEAAKRPVPALKAYRAAVRINPYEFHYRLNAARFIAASAVAVPDTELKLTLLEETIELGREGARLRPALADGFAMHGTYLLLAGAHGAAPRFEEAAAALDAALERDPFLPALLENRMKLADALGDHPLAASLRARLSRTIK